MVANKIVTNIIFSHRDIKLPGSQVGIDAVANPLVRAIAGVLVPPNTIELTGSDCRPGGNVVQPKGLPRCDSLAIRKLCLLR
jgi:hypothetical protein